MNESIKKQLLDLADSDYQKFSSRLLPGIDNLLGVRFPILRQLAKQMTKEEWGTYLDEKDEIYFEEVMLEGMIIGYLNEPLEVRLQVIRDFIPKIKNWSVCDSFCAG